MRVFEVDMNFTKEDLELVYNACHLAIAELQNQIGIFPDVIMYADDINDLEEYQTKLRELLKKVEKEI